MAKKPAKRNKKYNSIAKTQRDIYNKMNLLLGNLYFYASSVGHFRAAGLTSIFLSCNPRQRSSLIHQCFTYLADVPKTWRVRLDLFTESDTCSETIIFTVDETTLRDFTGNLDGMIKLVEENYDSYDGWSIIVTESDLIELSRKNDETELGIYNEFVRAGIYDKAKRLSINQIQVPLQQLIINASSQVYVAREPKESDQFIGVK